MNVLRTYQAIRRWPFGDRIFARLVAWRAPYFGSIGARFTSLSADRAEVFVRKRRRVTNHMGTVHAIAMANACELAAGTLCETATPKSSRWIPRGMQIEYKARAATSVRAVATLAEPIVAQRTYDVVIPVDVLDTNGNVVVHADISMYVSPRAARSAA